MTLEEMNDAKDSMAMPQRCISEWAAMAKAEGHKKGFPKPLQETDATMSEKQAKIIATIKKSGPQSRKNLSALSGLNLSTIRQNVDAMIKRRILRVINPRTQRSVVALVEAE